MKKQYIILIIILSIIIIAGIKLTGFNVFPGGALGECIDTDGGKNLTIKGITKYENRDKIYEDYCIQPRKVREHYCLLGLRIKAKTYRCDIECKDGACIE